MGSGLCNESKTYGGLLVHGSHSCHECSLYSPYTDGHPARFLLVLQLLFLFTYFPERTMCSTNK